MTVVQKQIHHHVVFLLAAPADGDAQFLERSGNPPHPHLPPPPHPHLPIMDSKKPSSGMLRHLRQKMLPRFRRGRANKLPVELDPNLDYRMSTSVPDVREMKQALVHGPSRTQPLQSDFPVYRSPFSLLGKPPGGATESGSGLKSTLPGQVTRRSEHRLSAPLDCTDWVSSQDFFQGLGEDKRTSSRSNQRVPASMEPEEQVQPERMPPNADPPPQETSQDALQVQTPRVKGRGSPSRLYSSLFLRTWLCGAGMRLAVPLSTRTC